MQTECVPKLFDFVAVDRRSEVAGFGCGSIASDEGGGHCDIYEELRTTLPSSTGCSPIAPPPPPSRPLTFACGSRHCLCSRGYLALSRFALY
jgi:hypothetical protein